MRLGFADKQHQVIPATACSTDDLTLSSAREETMASWQIKGLLVLSAALAAITLAARASAAAERPAQVSADQLSCAMIAGGGNGGFPNGRVLACCPRCAPQAAT
jgi:hypothetical protein